MDVIFTLLSIADQLAVVARDWAQKEAFTEGQKQAIEARLESSRRRLQEIYDKAREEPR